MKWKRGPCEFLSEKTFLIIKDDLGILKGTVRTDGVRHSKERTPAVKNVPNTGTWPPKMKRVPAFCDEPERPKTANLERPSVLDPELVDKLDMSLLSKELLCDSMTRFHQAKASAVGAGGTMAMSSSSSSSSLLLPPSPSARRRQCAVGVTGGDVQQPRIATTTSWAHDRAPVRRQRRSFEQIYESRMICQMEVDPRTSTEAQRTSPGVAVTQEQHAPVKRNFDVKRLDDNNNRNGPPKVLSTVKKKSSRVGIPSDLEIFTTASARSAPEPCKTCGRPDQPERFHSHPRGSQTKIKDIPSTTKPKIAPVPKSIQKPVALNFRSDRNRNRPEEVEVARDEMQPKPLRSPQNSQQTSRPSSAPTKRGPRTVTCYICGRDFGTAGFPIHEPKCMEKWERENNVLPPSQRRPRPQRPVISIEHNDWNAEAWEQSQEQLLPCAKCGRTFLPERLPIHERSCKAAPKNNDPRFERLSTADKPTTARLAVGPPTVPCQICGRRFGTRSIKIHEPQCNRRSQMQNSASDRNQSGLRKRQSATDDRDNASSLYPDTSQKKTVSCYICGREFGSSSIVIHEPQCLKKWHAENDKLSPARRRKEPQKPEVIYIQDPRTGNLVIDQAATAEVNWMSHLNQLVPCKRCGRTFNPDRVNIHEKSCKGNH